MKDELQKVLKSKPIRYITKEYLISSLGEEFYNSLLLRTEFISNKSLSEKIFCIVNDIVSPRTCRNCKHLITTNIESFKNFTREKYLNGFCSAKCYRTYKYDMSFSVEGVSFSKETIIQKINEVPLEKLVRDSFFMDNIKRYLNSICVEYRSMSAIEALYFVKNELTDIPKCVCGNRLKYLNKGRYTKFCSTQCNLSSTITKERRKRTVISKYGILNVFESPHVKRKIKETCLAKYGVDNYSKSNEYKERCETGQIRKRNLDYDSIVLKGRERFYNSLFKKRLKGRFVPLFTLDQFQGVGHTKYKFKCVKCGSETESTLDDGTIPRCYTCEPLLITGGQSKFEYEVIEYIKSIYNGVFLERNRELISPLELDIYLPDIRIAFEMNGLYWHSERNGKGRMYHLYKLKKCDDIGVRLIQIYEDEWRHRKRIVKSRIKNILSKNKKSIYARKCVVKEIDDKLKNLFLNKYHIQGEDRCAINLGLFYRDRLVSVMTFSKLRLALGQSPKENNWELSRFCSVSNFNIVGGASKLLKYFEKKYQPRIIKSYADRRWSTGSLYNKLGFTLIKKSFPNYWYLNNTFQKRIHRFAFRKDVLKNKLQSFNPNISEWENMKANGYDRIWDCGNLVYVKNYPN